VEGGDVHLRSRLLAAGIADDEMRRLIRAGELSPLRRGAYLRGPLPDDRVARHLAQVRAAAAQLTSDAVVSHVSAVALHGWAIWGIALGRVCVTRSRRNGGRVHPSVHVRSAPLRPDEIVLRGGIPVTAPARTVVDVARTAGFAAAVVVADQALATGLVTADQLAAGLRRQAGWPGVPAARRVVAFAEDGSRSVGESRSRVAMAYAGLPAPQLQWVVRDESGRHLGTTDFGWPQWHTVGEFDGLVKYGRLVEPGQTAADVVVAEKLREDALRDQGLHVVRWTWADLADFTPVATRLRHRLT
jgi:hypothetical protein